MKDIEYEPKNTQARTQYNKINNKDMEYLLDLFTRYMSLMGELRNNKDKNYSNLTNEYWSSKNKHLPKGIEGLNTPESFISGMLNNMKYGSQYDLSDTQMNAIEIISRDMDIIFNAVKHLNLQKQTTEMPEIKFRVKLFG